MQSLSIDQNDNDDSNSANAQERLDEQILKIVASCPDRTLKPARLSSELGISVNDACAQLCGLLSAVGGGTDGASFTFEKDPTGAGQPVMVFTFPPDFEKRARQTRRKETFQQVLAGFLQVTVKALKIFTAIGLILSLLIVTIAGMVGMVAALVAMSRGGHHGHRNDLLRRLRGMFFTIRQLLWCYAMFGGNFEGQDPFLREIAYDLALCTSVCCGNPGSLWFWFRASQLRNRQRGWGRRYSSMHTADSSGSMEGVALLNRGTWRERVGSDDEQDTNDNDDEYRGILSVAVEFLFGPTPNQPRPSEAEKWKLRAAVLVQLSTKAKGAGVSLEELAPYCDVPPPSLDRGLVAATVDIIAHFNGVPALSLEEKDGTKSDIENICKARFIFPELMAESQTVPRYQEKPNSDDATWESLFYLKEVIVSYHGSSTDIPSSLQERRYTLTQLRSRQFLHCALLGFLNFIGVIWLIQSVQPGGVLDMSFMGNSFLAASIQKGLLPVLHFYSLLFFAIPGGRLVLILVWNALLERRNRLRADYAYALQQN